ncbi:ribosome maturation factor RimM [Halorhodospira halochloris]|uniref:ribosome maturation factor RimM n=1 Tax=Halorhodospira halochloris TaxID=1052 RepID=UPI001EE8493A|nr:ribosome maturation factor RimM [Halorhodospira halochloris]MCG5530027.1 ribosome maturation factor RimM [Halorhodospira halochloris]
MVTVGRVVGLYGVQGWLRVYSYTQPKENLLAYPKWQLCGSKLLAEFAVEASKKQGKGLVAKLQRVDDRDQARAWLGFDIRIPRADLPELGEDEYYWADLLALEVYDLEQRHLGVVDHLLETGANDVMVVCGDRERLIPFVPGYYVKRVDLNRGFISVDWDPEF